MINRLLIVYMLISSVKYQLSTNVCMKFASLIYTKPKVLFKSLRYIVIPQTPSQYCRLWDHLLTAAAVAAAAIS